MQVEGPPAWPSGLRPHGACRAAPGCSVMGLAWPGPRRTGVLPQLLDAPRERWPPPTVPLKAAALCVCLCSCLAWKRLGRGSRQKAGRKASRLPGAGQPFPVSFRGVHCCSSALPRVLPSAPVVTGTSTAPRPLPQPRWTGRRTQAGPAGHALGAGASGSERGQRGWNPPSGSRCQEA